jgi:hypothetical protein
MIYGPGGYKTTDFLKIGTPMQLILWLLSTVLLATTTSSNFYISWFATFAALVVASLLMLGNPFACLEKYGNKKMEATFSQES